MQNLRKLAHVYWPPKKNRSITHTWLNLVRKDAAFGWCKFMLIQQTYQFHAHTNSWWILAHFRMWFLRLVVTMLVLGESKTLEHVLRIDHSQSSNLAAKEQEAFSSKTFYRKASLSWKQERLFKYQISWQMHAPLRDPLTHAWLFNIIHMGTA